ncbi:MAG: DUF998 domain-containing protein [Jiangellales bacterium]
MQEGSISSWHERVPKRTTMLLAIVAGVGPVLYIVLTVVLGLLWEGYDPIRDTQSELGAVDSPYQWVMNVAGFGGLGLSILAFAACYALVLRGGWPQAVAVVFLGVGGVGMVIVGFFPCDAGCVDVTATGRLHGVFSVPGAIGLPAAAILSAWVFARDGRFSTRWQVLSMLVGIFTLASGPVIQSEVLTGANGLLQRAGMWPALLWMTTVSMRLLTLDRRAPTAASRSR